MSDPRPRRRPLWRPRRDRSIAARSANVVRVVTYNVHRCRGLDRLVRPARIARVLQDLDADVIALQEVLGPDAAGRGQIVDIAETLGLHWSMAPVRLLRRYPFGNAVLSRWPIERQEQHDLTYRRLEQRGVQRVDIRANDAVLHIFNVHLGTALLERRDQARRLADWLGGVDANGARIVLGDFNEWLSGAAAMRLSEGLTPVDHAAYLGRVRTYPGVAPVFHLDHIFADASFDVAHVHLHRTRLALVASDHLPLAADLIPKTT